jgi:ABC-type bacteriocin/lantibiotic exporter with double-glycine peptidase domain
LLSVSHLQQRSQADCLPICAQMVLDFLGKPIPYHTLVKLFETRSFGTPFRNIQRLEQLDVSVTIDACSIDEITVFLRTNLPVIVSVDTADLKYWPQATDHVVVVTGVDAEFVYVNDPSLNRGHRPVPRSEFALAQLTFHHFCAILAV